MIISRGYNKELVREIARNCGSKAVTGSLSYIEIPFIQKNLYCEIFDDVAFFAGTFQKKHFRLYETAVKQECQRSGYGRAMIKRIQMLCQERGLDKITLRTSKEESAINFYRKVGGTVVGEKDGDWEVVIKV